MPDTAEQKVADADIELITRMLGDTGRGALDSRFRMMGKPSRKSRGSRECYRGRGAVAQGAATPNRARQQCGGATQPPTRAQATLEAPAVVAIAQQRNLHRL